MPNKKFSSSSSTSTCRRSHRRASPHQEKSLAPQPTQCSGDLQPATLDFASFFSSVEKVGLEPIEQRLAARPTIAAPTINLHGELNGVGPPETSANHARFFTGPYQRRVIPRAGHNLPQEVPGIVTEATLELIKATA